MVAGEETVPLNCALLEVAGSRQAALEREERGGRELVCTLPPVSLATPHSNTRELSD